VRCRVGFVTIRFSSVLLFLEKYTERERERERDVNCERVFSHISCIYTDVDRVSERMIGEYESYVLRSDRTKHTMYRVERERGRERFFKIKIETHTHTHNSIRNMSGI
jgi:hypothetical protein